MESTGDGVLAKTTVLERQLEAAQEISHLGSWAWDLASDAVIWSDELCRIYGFAPCAREITLEFFLSRVHADDRERVGAEIRAAVQRGGRFAHRERIVRADGAVRQLETIGEVISDPAGRPTSLIGTCRDVTDDLHHGALMRMCSDVVEGMEIGISVWHVEAPGPAGLRLLGANRACEEITNIAASACVGRSLADCFPAALATEIPALLLTADTRPPRRELALVRFARVPFSPTYAVKVFALGEGRVGLALEDVSLRVQTERLHFAERRSLEMLAAGAQLEDILSVIVLVIEELSPETLASVLVLDPSGTRLLHGAAPSLPDAYNRAIHDLPIGPTAGSCGTAAYRRDAVFVADIETDPLWADYRKLALGHGLRACWSTPILANDGRVLGTFALYYRTPRRPERGAVDLIARAVHVAGIAIERRQLDDQLRALSNRLQAIREDERTGIAREIHDELGQALTALKIDLAWVHRRRGEDPAVGVKLREMMQATDAVLESVRRISSELRPGVLDDLGLLAAIEWQAEEFQRRSGIPCEVRSALGDLQLDRDLATTVFRIFQEALTNVVRHASATRVDVTLGLERGKLRLAISDDGVGIPEIAPRLGSLGLLGMSERARRLGGDCTIQRREGRGTVVSLIVPLRFPAEHGEPTDAPRSA